MVKIEETEDEILLTIKRLVPTLPMMQLNSIFALDPDIIFYLKRDHIKQTCLGTLMVVIIHFFEHFLTFIRDLSLSR